MPEERVWMASYNLEDVTQLWYIQLQDDEGTPPWGRFKDLLNLCFGPPLRSAPLFELAECRRIGTAERRRLGLCFNCNEPYSRGHNRVYRRIFYLNGVEITAADEEPAGDDQQDGAPVFSLRAVAGMPICDSMQVRVSLGATTLVALLDTGSTHNFIAEDAARRTGLPI
ncbi:uncharacterized protein [Miscanthus floridulus]|uniref:uncharacterized protein n=1 Tax=Miscanthus floridulus TaxID=154761 RepID=UPI0034578973